MTTKRKFVAAPQTAAYVAASPDLADIHAVQAIARCDATPDQQRRFISWLNRATGVNEPSFRPGEDGRRETDFALGKKFVGDQFHSIVRVLVPDPN